MPGDEEHAGTEPDHDAGPPGDGWEWLRGRVPDFAEAYARLYEHSTAASPLDSRTINLIGVALNASVTTQNRSEVRRYMKAFLAEGGTPQELIEVLELTAVLGIHSCNVGVPLLERITEGIAAPAGESIDRSLRVEFERVRGPFNPLWERLATWDAEFLEAYVRFSMVPWTRGTLLPKVRELIYIAIDSSVTHLYPPGIERHMRNALAVGATPREILAALELTSSMGIQSVRLGLQVLDEIAQSSPSE